MQNKCKPVVGLTGIILALGLMAPSGVQASALATPVLQPARPVTWREFARR